MQTLQQRQGVAARPMHRHAVCVRLCWRCLPTARTRTWSASQLGGARTTTAQVRQFSWAEDVASAQACVATAAAALQRDTSTGYFCRDGCGEQFYRRVLEGDLEAHPHLPQIYTIERRACVAIAYQYPRPTLPPLQHLRQAVQAPWHCLRWERFAEGTRTSSKLETLRSTYLAMHGPYLYISVMATCPAQQGHGLGTALLKHLMAQGRAAGQHVYVEAISENSNRFFKQSGFQQLFAYRPTLDAPTTFVCVLPLPASS